MSLLDSERRLTPTATALTSACALTGISTYIFSDHSSWLQWSVLAHLLTGIGCTLALLPYLLIHLWRTVGVRRPAILISGLVSIPLLAAFLGSGWLLMLYGQEEHARWLYTLHVWTAFAFVAGAILHLLLHLRLLPERRRLSGDDPLPSVPAHTLRRLIAFNVIVQLGILGSSLIYGATLHPAKTTPAVADYEYSYGEHPFRPSQTETAGGHFIEASQIADSHRCISCHQDIGKQWFSSAHREAASDPAYVTNVSLLAEKKGISATRYCEGCHGPVALLAGELSPGGQHAGIAGTTANLEGIPCKGCHGIASLVHLKGVASYQFEPTTELLFSQSENPILMRLHDWLLRVRPDQHRQDMGKPLLADSKFCSVCHTQFMDADMNDWGWVKMQDEYGAWLKSPFSKHHEERFANVTSSRCQDCHMPLVDSDDPSADQYGRIRSHHFPGANTVLPLLRGDREHLAATVAFLQSSKLRLSIDMPSRPDALQTLQALDEGLRNFEEAPFFYYLGETATLRVVVSNQGVGHDFPGGTIDINEAWVELLVLDAEGGEIYTSGTLGENGDVDPEAHFYRSLAVDRTGSLVWRHDLFNMVGESFRRVIPAGSSDVVEYSFSVPSWVKSPLTVTATLNYRKLNDRYARWALKEQYVPIPIVDMAWDSLTIPVLTRKDVEELNVEEPASERGPS